VKKARTVKQKVMGRPRTGITPIMGFRADTATRAAIIRWAKNQPDVPSLSEAIRRLVEIGLTVKRTRGHSDQQKQRAKEIAGTAIDAMSDDDAHADDQASRKRRLLKGPEEFRDVRIDRKRK
jgi:hypothetical protein